MSKVGEFYREKEERRLKARVSPMFEEEGPQHPDEMKPEYRHRGFLRSTSNVNSITGQRQISLPPRIWKLMGWKLNDNLQIDIIKTGMNHSYNIMKEE